MPEADLQVFRDAVQRIREQRGAEVPRRVPGAPGHAMALVGPQQHAVALLAHVDLAVEIDRVQHHLAGAAVDLHHLGHILGDEVLVLHGQDRQLQAYQAPHLTRPQTTAVDHVLRNDVALVGDHLPHAIGPLSRVHDPRMRADLGPALARRAAEGIGRAVRVHMPLDRVVHGAHELALVKQRQQALGFVERDQLSLHAHVASLGVDVLQPLVARRGCRQHQSLGHVQAHRLAGNLLDLLVQVDGVLLQLGHVRVAVDGVHAAGCVPGGAGSQLQALQQHNVAPTLLGEVVQHAGPHHPAANHDDPIT